MGGRSYGVQKRANKRKKSSDHCVFPAVSTKATVVLRAHLFFWPALFLLVGRSSTYLFENQALTRRERERYPTACIGIQRKTRKHTNSVAKRCNGWCWVPDHLRSLYSKAEKRWSAEKLYAHLTMRLSCKPHYSRTSHVVYKSLPVVGIFDEAPTRAYSTTHPGRSAIGLSKPLGLSGKLHCDIHFVVILCWETNKNT